MKEAAKPSAQSEDRLISEVHRELDRELRGVARCFEAIITDSRLTTWHDLRKVVTQRNEFGNLWYEVRNKRNVAHLYDVSSDPELGFTIGVAGQGVTDAVGKMDEANVEPDASPRR
jgi:hypothetical protein